MNLGVIDFNPWPARRAISTARTSCASTSTRLRNRNSDEVREVAMTVRETLDDHGLLGFPKTSGSRGIHVNVRIEPRWSSPRCAARRWRWRARSSGGRSWRRRSGGRRSATACSSTTTRTPATGPSRRQGRSPDLADGPGPAAPSQGPVASSHHQAVADPGPLRILATSGDGVIEAVTAAGRKCYVGVQWHPECTADPALVLAFSGNSWTRPANARTPRGTPVGPPLVCAAQPFPRGFPHAILRVAVLVSSILCADAAAAPPEEAPFVQCCSPGRRAVHGDVAGITQIGTSRHGRAIVALR